MKPFVTVSHSTALGSPDGRKSTENRTKKCPTGPHRKKDGRADPVSRVLFP